MSDTQTQPEPLRIIRLEAENIKRLKAIQYTPDSDMVVVGGKNGQGKTSLIDSIEWLIGGKPDATMPIRNGQPRGRIFAILGHDGKPVLKGERIFTAREDGGYNTYLRLSNAEDMDYKSPQGVYDKLTGTIAFDPLEFTRKKPREQVEILKECLHLDFTGIDARRQAAYDERTGVHHQLNQLKAVFEGVTIEDGLPEEEISIADLSDKLRQANETNRANDIKRQGIRQAEQTVQVSSETVEYRTREVNRIREELAEAERSLTQAEAKLLSDQETLKTARAELETLQDSPTDSIQSELEGAEATNRKVRVAKEIAKAEKSWNDLEVKRVALNKAIEDCDAAKTQAIKDAALPVAGLTFTEEGIFLGAVPFQQASSAEQLKVSFAIIAAQSPRLRVVLIRDGSLLDDANLEVVKGMAAKYGMQLWIERVSEGEEVSLIIEDGAIQGQQPQLEAVTGGAQ
jgi:hypothetical protein